MIKKINKFIIVNLWKKKKIFSLTFLFVKFDEFHLKGLDSTKAVIKNHSPIKTENHGKKTSTKTKHCKLFSLITI